jgi:hypothetical protein
MSSFRARSGRTRGIVGTWKQAVTQLFLRKVLPANHQKDGQSDSRSIQTNNILAFPPFLQLGRSSLRNINRLEFPQSKLPPSLSITTIPPLFFIYSHCNAFEFWMVSMLETNEFGSSTEIVHKFGMISVDGVYSYQSSYGFASGQIPRRSQGTLLSSSGEPKVSNPWNNVQCKDSI